MTENFVDREFIKEKMQDNIYDFLYAKEENLEAFMSYMNNLFGKKETVKISKIIKQDFSVFIKVDMFRLRPVLQFIKSTVGKEKMKYIMWQHLKHLSRINVRELKSFIMNEEACIGRRQIKAGNAR